MLGLFFLLSFAAISNVCGLETSQRASKSIIDQMSGMVAAFADKAHQSLFESHYDQHLKTKVDSLIPPKDKTNSKDSVFYEAPLRKMLLEKTTELVHGIQVARSSGVLAPGDGKTSMDQKDMDIFAKDIVSSLASSLINSNSNASSWMRGLQTLYYQFVKRIIDAITLIFHENPDDQCKGLAELSSTVASLVQTIVDREVYSADAINKAMEESTLKGFLMMVNVALDVQDQGQPTVDQGIL